MLSHLGWINSIKKEEDISPFIHKHFLILKPFLSKKGLNELNSLYI